MEWKEIKCFYCGKVFYIPITSEIEKGLCEECYKYLGV